MYNDSLSNTLFFPWHNSPLWTRVPSLSRLHDHSDTPQSLGLLWTSDQPDPETSTWQHTTISRDRHLCPWRCSNRHYQQASGCRPNERLRPRGYYDWHKLYCYILYGPFSSLYYVCVFGNHTYSYWNHALAHQ
jgi:hypothetical protein